MSQESWDLFVSRLKSDDEFRKRYGEFIKEANINSMVEFAKEQGYAIDPEVIVNSEQLRARKNKRNILVGSIAVLLIAVPLSLINHQVGSIEGARDLLNDDKSDEAIIMTTKILDGRQDSEAYFLRARAYQDKRQYEKAIEDFTHAIAINDAVDYYFYSRGNAYRSIGMEPKATIDFKKAIEINPRNVNAYGNLGLSLYKQKKLEDAIAWLDKAIKVEPQHANNLRMRGDIKYAFGDLKGSISDFNRCIEIDVRKADTQSYRSGVVAQCYEAKGWSYLKLGNAGDACNNWQKAISLGRAKLSSAIDQYCK